MVNNIDSGTLLYVKTPIDIVAVSLNNAVNKLLKQHFDVTNRIVKQRPRYRYSNYVESIDNGNFVTYLGHSNETCDMFMITSNEKKISKSFNAYPYDTGKAMICFFKKKMHICEFGGIKFLVTRMQLNSFFYDAKNDLGTVGKNTINISLDFTKNLKTTKFVADLLKVIKTNQKVLMTISYNPDTSLNDTKKYVEKVKHKFQRMPLQDKLKLDVSIVDCSLNKAE